MVAHPDAGPIHGGSRLLGRHGPVCVLVVFNVAGIRKLQVENCFINYFKSTTEIHQGMKVMDQQLGGTTPLDVVIDLEPTAPSEATPPADAADKETVFDQFEELDTAAPGNQQKYWFTPEKMARIAAVHDYLDGLPETGKVLSVVTLVRMIERVNGGKPLDNLELALLFDKIPDQLKEILVTPYVSVEHNQVRLAVRIRDSDPGCSGTSCSRQIRADLTGKLGPEASRVASRHGSPSGRSRCTWPAPWSCTTTCSRACTPPRSRPWVLPHCS